MTWVGESYVTRDGSIPHFALMMQNCFTPPDTFLGKKVPTVWLCSSVQKEEGEKKATTSFCFSWSKINDKRINASVIKEEGQKVTIEVALRTGFCFCFSRSNSYLHQCWFLMIFYNTCRKCRKWRIKHVQITEEKKIDICFSSLRYFFLHWPE